MNGFITQHAIITLCTVNTIMAPLTSLVVFNISYLQFNASNLLFLALSISWTAKQLDRVKLHSRLCHTDQASIIITGEDYHNFYVQLTSQLLQSSDNEQSTIHKRSQTHSHKPVISSSTMDLVQLSARVHSWQPNTRSHQLSRWHSHDT